MLAVVLAGGELHLSARVATAVGHADLIIAADSGARHVDALQCRIDVVLGDFDSSERVELAGVENIAFPSAKDETDTHLALREAVRRGADRVVLVAALRGPRLDHGAGNLGLLGAAEFRAIDLRAIDGADEARAVRGSAALVGREGDLVSLLALTETASGITSSGLLYQLHDDTLNAGETRGMSNELTGQRGALTVARGALLVIHRDGGDPNRRP